MNKKGHCDKQTLLLAFIIGLSMNGSFSALFSAFVPFSIFPLIALGLAVWYLHQRYLHCDISKSLPTLVAAFFLLGILLYSTIVRVEHPDMGSNFVPTLLMVALLFWIIFRVKAQKNDKI